MSPNNPCRLRLERDRIVKACINLHDSNANAMNTFQQMMISHFLSHPSHHVCTTSPQLPGLEVPGPESRGCSLERKGVSQPIRPNQAAIGNGNEVESVQRDRCRTVLDRIPGGLCDWLCLVAKLAQALFQLQLPSSVVNQTGSTPLLTMWSGHSSGCHTTF